MATDFQDQEALRRLYAFASTLNRMVQRCSQGGCGGSGG